MTFKELLLQNEFVMLDGAMGTALQKNGLQMGDIPELLSITNSDLLIKIHKNYVQSGAQIIYTNTFGANSYKLDGCEYSTTQLIEAAIKNARTAVAGTSCLVALDIGPIGQLLEPAGGLSFEQAYDLFKEQVIAGQDADVIVIETMTDLYEIKAAVLAAKENSTKPILCTMTFEQNLRTFTGCSISSMALTLEGLGIDAIGVNCSLGPVELIPIVKELSRWTTLPIIVKPNAGLPDPETNEYDITPEQFATSLTNLIQYGVKIFGGCCGTDEHYMSAVKKKLDGQKFVHINPTIPSAVCSSTNTVVVSEPKIIGERINPTGKKLFKEALKSNNIDYILSQGLEQVKAGADILDVNVGLPEIDEQAMMIKAIKALQSVVDVPLQIDSTIPEVLKSALRIYNGKPIVNSVNGEEDSLNAILPLVKQYGAGVVCLTLDKDGIPKTADARFNIAKKIVNRAISIGIPLRDIYVDCLTLTASAEQEGVMETLTALKRVKDELGVKTVLGVSNISFGLPNRELINHTFLTMALTYGLDLAIINPNIDAMTGVIRSYKLLANHDKNSTEYIASYNNVSTPKQNATATVTDLAFAIENGLKSEGGKITELLLQTEDEMTIINQRIIPALDRVGILFEQGKLFLPQLIGSATTSQACFDVIKQKLSRENNAPQSKGKIILATVKGDMHDIGKNIVKVLLENYGYTVIDLGKDVPCQAIVDCAIEQNVKLVGLSALMTTTVKSMELTISMLKEQGVDCTIFVGGAVLTNDYAMKIGADFYCKDAKESVDVAKKILG